MSVYFNDSSRGPHPLYSEAFSEPVDLNDAIIIAARDGKDICLLESFAMGEFDGKLEGKVDSLMRSVLYTAFMNQHDSVIQAIFAVSPSSFDSYDKHLIGYDHVANLHAQMSEGLDGESVREKNVARRNTSDNHINLVAGQILRPLKQLHQNNHDLPDSERLRASEKKIKVLFHALTQIMQLTEGAAQVNSVDIQNIFEKMQGKLNVDQYDLEDAIIVAARDGKDIGLLEAFAVGKFDDRLEERAGLLMREVLCTAYMNKHDAVIKAIFSVNPSSLNTYSQYTIGYDHLLNLHAEITEGTGSKL